MRNSPSIKQIIFYDYITMNSVISGVFFIGFGVYGYYSDNELYLPLGFSVAALLLLIIIWRLLVVRNLFKNGVEVNATISRVSFYRSRCRVGLEYSYDSNDIETAWITLSNQKTRNLRNMAKVKILINPNKVKQVIVLDVFNLD
ncbi:MAG: hypothetical protein ABH890_03990 [Bacillota bacterium]